MTTLREEVQAQFELLVARQPLPPPPAPDGAGAAPLAPQVQVTDFAARGVHLEIRLHPEQAVAAAELLRERGFILEAVTGVDWLAEQEMEVLYDYFHPTDICRIAVRARLPRSQPEIATVSTVFAGANWHERETHEFFGIRFLGHPYLVPLLLPEDATFHPLRKDFAGL